MIREQAAARLHEFLRERLRAHVAALRPPGGGVLEFRPGVGGLAPSLEWVDFENRRSQSLKTPAQALNSANALRLRLRGGRPDPRPAAAAVACMALHALPRSAAAAALRDMGRAAPLAIVVDYCLPERNLALPAACLAHFAERLTGGEHYRCYRRYMAEGALEGLLRRHGLRPLRRIHALGGAVMAAAWRSDQGDGKII